MELAKKLLEEGALLKKEEAIEEGRKVWEKQDIIWDEILESIRNYKMPNCPVCQKGRLHFAGMVRDDRQEFG